MRILRLFYIPTAARENSLNYFNILTYLKSKLQLILMITVIMHGYGATAVTAEQKSTLGVLDVTSPTYDSTNRRRELLKLIISVEQEHSIPKNLLLSIIEIESGLNPYVLNASGTTIKFTDKESANTKLSDLIEKGVTNIDVGISQINYKWHGSKFKNPETMLDPFANISYAAKLITSLYKQHRSWHKAVRYYHSASSYYHKPYSRKVVIAWLGH